MVKVFGWLFEIASVILVNAESVEWCFFNPEMIFHVSFVSFQTMNYLSAKAFSRNLKAMEEVGMPFALCVSL